MDKIEIPDKVEVPGSVFAAVYQILQQLPYAQVAHVIPAMLACIQEQEKESTE